MTLVADQLRRIQEILRELINFSRPASTAREKLAVTELLAEALGIAKFYKGGKRRSISIEAQANLPPVIGVRGQLVSVILNLVLNAIDATAKGGRIELGAAAEASGVRIWVRDDGAGIGPDQHGKLFQPYFTTKRYGTGLGLFMSRKLLAEHGGTIECDSGDGIGTTFTMRLPAVDVRNRLAGETAESAAR